MSKSIQTALHQNIPRLSGALPPELIELASSLLAQSHSKCSNLKAEEEVARTYVCANIACERLKTTLDLPQIEPRPPIAPKLYKKLYTYFDKTLLPGISRKRRRQNDDLEDRRPLPQRQLQTKGQTLDFRTNRTPRKGLKYGRIDEKLPKWVGPAIRQICKETETPNAVQHVIVGVESVWFQPCPNTERRDVVEKGHLAALVATIWSLVVSRLAEIDAGAITVKWVKQVLKLLNALKENDEVVKRIGLTDETWEGYETTSQKEHQAWLVEVNENWKEMEWWNNINEGSGLRQESQNDLNHSDSRIANDPGLGRMVDQRFEITEAKTAAYNKWKEAMLIKIQELVAQEPVEEMDVT
ncbi:origin recognition complex, subunit 6 [Calycina marina]|uniref:Origin recognition complex, subunit 6 n=1 Tax=Calycina marina TaxID=1763456 RepID=A0A9P7Z200_9HELO|nr:origin recognition complex, subunit 6 [Calycina marina]